VKDEPLLDLLDKIPSFVVCVIGPRKVDLLVEFAVAVSPVGAAGAVSSESVVALAVLEYAELPALLVARTRNVYIVLGDSPVAEYAVRFASRDATCVKDEPLLDCSTRYPVSLFALSVHVRLIWLVEFRRRRQPRWCSGRGQQRISLSRSRIGIRRVTALLVARTRNVYIVLGDSPVAEYAVRFASRDATCVNDEPLLDCSTRYPVSLFALSVHVG